MDWKAIKRSQCKICDTKQSTTNPMAKCFECSEKFCFDHIHGGQVNSKMKENDLVRDICDECQKKHGYLALAAA